MITFTYRFGRKSENGIGPALRYEVAGCEDERQARRELEALIDDTLNDWRVVSASEDGR